MPKFRHYNSQLTCSGDIRMYKFFPDDVKTYSTTFLDTQSLINFAQTNKANLKLALPILIKRQKQLLVSPNINLVTSGRTTFIYTKESLYACGYNKHGQLGLGHKKACLTFTKIENIAGRILQVQPDWYHTFVITDQGLYAAGSNSHGRLGCGAFNSRESFTKIDTIQGTIKQIIVKSAHTFVITDKGLYASGNNEYGQLGLGDNNDKNVFTLVENIEGEIKQIISDDFRTFIITDQGLYSCGENSIGTLGLSDNEDRNVFNHVDNIAGQIQHLYYVMTHIFILTEQNLYACGDNTWGQLGLGNKQDQNKFMPVENIEGNIQKVISDLTRTLMFTDKGAYACGSYNNKDNFMQVKEEDLVNSLMPGASVVSLSDIKPGAKIKVGVSSSMSFDGTVQQVIVENDCHFFLTDRGLFSMGKNNDGQLGLGSISERHNNITQVETIPEELNHLLNIHSQINALQKLATQIEKSSANANEFEAPTPMTT